MTEYYTPTSHPHVFVQDPEWGETDDFCGWGGYPNGLKCGFEKGEHPEVPNGTKASERQVGGDHYKSMAIQPLDFIMKNDLPFAEANIVKYACRHKAKGGREDLEKVIHYAQLAIEHYYPEEQE